MQIDPFELSQDAIYYQISRLTESQREIIFNLVHGKSDKEISQILSINVPVLRVRLASACDRVGVRNRAQLICMFSIWAYAHRNDVRKEMVIDTKDFNNKHSNN